MKRNGILLLWVIPPALLVLVGGTLLEYANPHLMGGEALTMMLLGFAGLGFWLAKTLD